MSGGQHLGEHPPYLVELVPRQGDLWGVPAEPVDGDGANLLGDDSTTACGYGDSVHPAVPFDGGQRRDSDQLAQGDAKVEA